MELVFILLVYFICTAESCNSGSGSGSGSSSGPKYETLQFSEINLHYDLTPPNDPWRSYMDDVNELAYYHGLDGARMKGTITSFYEIVRYAHEFSDVRRPEIRFSFNRTEESCDLVFKQSDVGDTYLSNVPVYTDINTLTISIKSIVTTVHQAQLCWSKTIDLYGSSWHSLDNANLSVSTKMSLPSYTKCIGAPDELFVRPVNGKYRLAAYGELSLSEDDRYVLYSDDELTLFSSTLQKPIYYEGEFISDRQWSEPIILQKL